MSSSALQTSVFICRSCSRHVRPCLPSSSSATTRAFSSTPPAAIPSSSSPYSPHYIDIPFPPQRYPVWQPRAKGKRPVPRNIFPSNGGSKKITPEYLALVSKEPINRSRPGEDAPATEKAYISWKENMAECRRRNIRDGLLQLHTETQQRSAIIAARSAKKQARRAELLAEEDPEVVQLTTPTIISALRTKKTLTDPGREERLAASRERYLQGEHQKVLARQEELHELYIRANEFIFTEAQLDVLINAKFSALDSAEEMHAPPPDSTRILTEETRETQGPEEFLLKDEPILRIFADALTGGSRRPRKPTSIVRDDGTVDIEALDVTRPKLGYLSQGYRDSGYRDSKKKDDAEAQRQNTSSLFTIMDPLRK
ncbi:hypothetical protein ABW20_dc0110373 [Dactylellina cionopaga]|nr:hypothetical protein ABW20_dc0110373 [Dactylellina cionopaga]